MGRWWHNDNHPGCELGNPSSISCLHFILLNILGEGVYPALFPPTYEKVVGKSETHLILV